MPTFGAVQAIEATQTIAPKVKVKLPPSAFKDGPQQPTEPRDVGLRLLSEGDIQGIRATAARTTAAAMKNIPTTADVWIEAYNNALMVGAVCEALCHPEDVSRDYWELQRTAAPTYISQGGMERLWDELEKLKIREAPTAPEATADDIALLSARLAHPGYARNVPSGDARALRRMLRHCLDILEANDVSTDANEVIPNPNMEDFEVPFS